MSYRPLTVLKGRSQNHVSFAAVLAASLAAKALLVMVIMGE